MLSILIYLLYRVLLLCAAPFILLYLVWRCFRTNGYSSSLSNRLGFLPPTFQQTSGGAVWLHAISVGEIQTSIALIRHWKAARPGVPVFVSAGTIAGYRLAAGKLDGLSSGVFYAPLDYVCIIRRVLRRLRPALVIVLETEIWPNLWREARRSGASLMVANGRISNKALPRYLRLAPLLPSVLGQANRILAQDQVSYERFLRLGAPARQLVKAGNLKYDFEPPLTPEAIASLIARSNPAKIWIAASTMPPAYAGDVDEDNVVLDAFQSLIPSHPRLLLILVPRRPEQFEVAAQKLTARRLSFVRRSEPGAHSSLRLPGVLLVDSIGELAGLFPLADAVFMGGTLAARGGHNLLEPAWFGKPIVSGPNLQNFPEIAEDFRRNGACVEIDRPAELAKAIDDLLVNDKEAAELGAKAAALARARAGAVAIAVDEALILHDLAVPVPFPSLPARLLLTPLTWLWRVGAALKRSMHRAGARRLPVPVISIGGIGMGGAGKTPVAIHLGRLLVRAGYQPGFLTRGYKRRVPTRFTLVEPGGTAPADATGDEGQLILRAGVWPVGIGSNRYETGLRLLEKFPCGALILDDGFQHWRLARDADVVVIDALNPFAGGAVFPLGHLREPLPHLRRASVFIIARAQPGQVYQGIRNALHRYNPGAPVFLARQVPLAWIDAVTGESHPLTHLDGMRSGAFCGIGNPGSFWQSLDEMGCGTLFRAYFQDHHHYRPGEVRRMASQCKAAGVHLLLTTGKDAVNLPAGMEKALDGVKLYWLDTGIEIDREPEFLNRIKGFL